MKAKAKVKAVVTNLEKGLRSVRVGDAVAKKHTFSSVWFIEEVTSVSRSVITIGGLSFCRKTGNQLDGNDYYIRSIAEGSLERLRCEKLADEIANRKSELRRLGEKALRAILDQLDGV